MNKQYGINGWIQLYEEDERVVIVLSKSIKSFIKAFHATKSQHRSTVSIAAKTELTLVHYAYIEFYFKGTYQQCHSFRTSLLNYCFTYNLSLDRGDEIFLLKDQR